MIFPRHLEAKRLRPRLAGLARGEIQGPPTLAATADRGDQIQLVEKQEAAAELEAVSAGEDEVA